MFDIKANLSLNSPQSCRGGNKNLFITLSQDAEDDNGNSIRRFPLFQLTKDEDLKCFP